MKFNKIFFAGLIAIAALSSCVSEDLKYVKDTTEKGRMVLDVSLLEPEATRAQQQVYDFPVIVTKADGTPVASYATVSAVPASVELPVGSYVVSSHTPGECEKRSTTPYYEGSTSMQILNGITTNVNLVCLMKNSRISINATKLSEVFSSWAITLNDGDDTAMSFSSSDSRREWYYLFDEGVEQLKMNFTGVRAADNSIVKTEVVLKKNNATSTYGDDTTEFRGGDALVINLTPASENPTTGKIDRINITADVTFAETGKTEVLDVVDADSGNQGGNQGGDDTGSITLNLPENMTVSFTTDPSLGDTYIKCNNGINSLKVRIVSSSAEMMSSLSDLNDSYGVDFIGGAEVVGNQALVTLFDDLGQTLSVPAQGDIEYTFPIGNFFGLLAFLSGEHTFYLTVTDMNGNTKDGELKLTVE